MADGAILLAHQEQFLAWNLYRSPVAFCDHDLGEDVLSDVVNTGGGLLLSLCTLH